MPARGQGPDFIEALARGLDVLRAFTPDRPHMSLSEIATATDLARPTARRILLTLAELNYVRISDGMHSLTPRVLELGMAYVGSLGLWDVARPHLEELVGKTGESSSMAQLDGSDIVYVARIAVPKLIGLRVDIGTKFPAMVTSQGKVLLAAFDDESALRILDQPSRSDVPAPAISANDVRAILAETRARGWAVADQELAPGVRSIAVPVADGSGMVTATMNVTVHASETSMHTLTDEYLPFLLDAAARTTEDWTRWADRPVHRVARARQR